MKLSAKCTRGGTCHVLTNAIHKDSQRHKLQDRQWSLACKHHRGHGPHQQALCHLLSNLYLLWVSLRYSVCSQTLAVLRPSKSRQNAFQKLHNHCVREENLLNNVPPKLLFAEHPHCSLTLLRFCILSISSPLLVGQRACHGPDND